MGKTTVKLKEYERSIIYYLEIISILLVISGLQLQRSVSKIPATIETIQPNREVDTNPNTHHEIFERQNYSRLNYSDRLIENATKNSISQGKS